MIQPDDIRHTAEKLFPRLLHAWLDGDESLFPYVVRGSKQPDREDFAAATRAVCRLREQSKEIRGFGYTVIWREVNSRRFGRNPFPDQIRFETREDLLRLIGKQREFAAFTAAAGRIIAEFPTLTNWVRSRPIQLLNVCEELDGLLDVLRYFCEHPRPNRFARELPIPVDTKFIERHQTILRQWFDAVLPPQAIRADETHFERRYGLRYATEPHLRVRLLDAMLLEELSFPYQEVSLPLAAIATLPVKSVRVFIVENRVNLLTFPPRDRGIALEGRGCAVTELRYVPWLTEMTMTYWGDIDVEGFQILSSLRAAFPQARSLLMDLATLQRWHCYAVPGTGTQPDPPRHLDQNEQEAFAWCRQNNLRLEQERIPQAYMVEALFKHLG